MSARRRSRRHGGAGEATAAGGTTVTGGGVGAVPIEIVSGSLVDVVAAEMAPAPNDAEIDGAGRRASEGAQGSRPGSARSVRHAATFRVGLGGGDRDGDRPVGSSQAGVHAGPDAPLHKEPPLRSRP
jgi:hypothetical protein